MKNNPSLVLSHFASKVDLPNYRAPGIAYCHTLKDAFLAGKPELLFRRLENERGEFVFVNALFGIKANTLLTGAAFLTVNQKI